MIVDRERVAEALPGYLLGEQLGSGAFGLVLAGTHRQMGRPVAIKVMAAMGTASPAAGFAAEARMLARLDHPHVVRVYDYVEDRGLCMVVMELLAGGTLTRQRAAMDPEQVCAVALAVAAALDHAHRHKVLHRDIKADNIMFAGDGTLRVTDFGIAKLFEGSGTTTTGIAGTPAYMAPEQIEGGQLGPWTDLYALGIVLYSLFTGRLPFDPKLPLLVLLSQQVTEPPPPMPGVAAPLAEVVLRMLAKSPADRPPDAATFALELASAATAVFGVGWTARGRLPLHLDEAVRAVTNRPPGWTRWDFFIAHASADQQWADWIAWELEAAGYQVLLQAQEGAARSRWTADLRDGIRHCAQVLVLLSGSGPASVVEQIGWGATHDAEAETHTGRFVPVRVEDCPHSDPPGTAPVLDLFGYSADTARKTLLDWAAVALAGRAESPGPAAHASLPPVRAMTGSATLVPPRLPAMLVAPPFPARLGPPPPEHEKSSSVPTASSGPPASAPPVSSPPVSSPPATDEPAANEPAANERASERSRPSAEAVPDGAEPAAGEPREKPTAGRPTGPRVRSLRRGLERNTVIVGVVVLVLAVAVGVLTMSVYPRTSPRHPTALPPATVPAHSASVASPTRSPSVQTNGSASPSAAVTTPPSSSSATAAGSTAPTNAAPNAVTQAAVRPTAFSISGINGGDDRTQVPGSEADTSWVGNNATCSAWLDNNGSGALAGVLNTSLTQSCVAELFRSDGMAYAFSASWGAKKTNFIPVAGYTMWICVWHADQQSTTEQCSPRFGMNGNVPVRK
ncbi:protein kinase [Frankia sp. Ag45/Mut15]|uniref:non-specific serine/threonine protein kinase n=1 Tax=Frankia umida TaxID=573489 RepID=A0ABT0K4H7_9ACTN|nr:protein kinase [Frankia umida]MCK9878693.1 protein kinase [Frankia umida]